MLVKNIIKSAVKLLNKKDVLLSLDKSEIDDESVIEDLDDLLLATNLVNNTIASSYIELIKTSDVVCLNNVIKFSDISANNIIEIKTIKNNEGYVVDYKINYDGIHIDNGNYIIEYSYFPTEVTIDSNIDYYTKLNDLTFAMGVVGEYLFLKGSIDEGAIWDKRFKQSLFNCVRPRRSIVMPKRRWY